MNSIIKVSASILLSIVPSLASASWESDYALAPGFALESDTEGYHLPSAIAFVPNPGPNPQDPLYFVTELRGTIKVVTNDRTVHIFESDFFDATVVEELPAGGGEVGIAGIVLDPKHGYVFVSYGYRDPNGLYRNAVSRFETKPQTFAIKPKSHISIAPIFEHHLAQVSHQVGPMAIIDEHLYICVGDALVSTNSRDLDSPMGKVLRINLDGSVPDGNPFATDKDPLKTRNLIWASGLRNPFSIEQIQDRLYVCENGPNNDRLVEIRPGADYIYDGSNESSSSNALFVWRNAVSPVQMDHNPAMATQANFPPEMRNFLFIALSGALNAPLGVGKQGEKSVVGLGIDPATGMLSHTPVQVFAYDGPGSQLPVGLAWGPDGLYIVNLYPDSEGKSRILKMRYDIGEEHPKTIAANPKALLQRYACYSCHSIDGEGWHVGPPIERLGYTDRLLEKLSSPAYQEQISEVDQLEMAPYNQYAQARTEVANAEGREKAIKWLTYRILEPRFDQKNVAMPNQGAKYNEARQLAEWLLAKDVPKNVSLKDRVKSFLPKPTLKTTLAFFILGGILGCGFAWIIFRITSRPKDN